MWINALLGAALPALATLHLIASSTLKNKLKRKEEEAILLKEERLSERQGRTKAERELRELQLELAQSRPLDAAPNGVVDLRQIAFPLRPIGTLRSCFNKRNGTPRQPLLVPAARSALTLRPELAADIFEGLQKYSHCWVLPCPIGLSVAEIVKVNGSTLILGGADIVDGSPVLDVKPYVPFCDAVLGATAPAWVAPRAEDEPLEISSVEIPEAVDQMLQKCWEESNNSGFSGGGGQAAAASGGNSKSKRKSRGCKNVVLYSKYEEYKALVLQVLSRDIRSVTQRVKVPAREQKADAGTSALPALFPPATASSNGNGEERIGGDKEEEEGKWHVELDGVEVTYEVVLNQTGEKRVVVKSASLIWDGGG
ncbi:hypothetical protein Ndes2526A_g08226 [Nannochloris sp. 'desiccata']